MRTLSLFVIAVFVLLALAQQQVFGYFHLDQEAFGAPTKTVLPDGRLRFHLPEVRNAPFPKNGFAANLPPVAADHPQQPSYSLKMDVIVKAMWKFIDVLEHTDHKSQTCHEYGDQNLRVSLFGISDELKNALKTNPTSVILHADANKLKCHGFPFIRRVQQAYMDLPGVSNGEIIVVTHRISYEQVFDHADIDLSITHPHLTHLEYNMHTGLKKGGMAFDQNARDAGVRHNEPATVGASLVPRHPDVTAPRKIISNYRNLRDYLLPKEDAEKPSGALSKSGVSAAHLKTVALSRSGKTQGWFKKIVSSVAKPFVDVAAEAKKKAEQEAARIAAEAAAKIKAAKEAAEKKLAAEAEAARIKALAFAEAQSAKAKEILNKGLEKANGVYRGVRSASNLLTSTTSNLVNSVGKGFTSGIGALQSLVTVNVDIPISQAMTFEANQNKKLGIVSMNAGAKFVCTLKFVIQIRSNKLDKVSFTLGGDLTANAAASFTVPARFSDEAQTTIFEIEGPRISFMLSVVPVWIDTSLPIIAGFTIDFQEASSAKAALDISAKFEGGVEYVDGKMKQIAGRSFTKTSNLKYSASINADITPYAGIQQKFALYSFIVAYGTLTFGLPTNIQDHVGTCDMKITSSYELKYSASMGIDLALGPIPIYSHDFLTVQLFALTFPAHELCLNYADIKDSLLTAAGAALTVLPPSLGGAFKLPGGFNTQGWWPVGIPLPWGLQQERAALALGREAHTLADQEPTTEFDNRTLTDSDSGKHWTSEMTCPSGEVVNFDTTGYFLQNLTLLYLSISRNVTDGMGNYSLVNQGAFYWFENNFSLGLSTRAEYIPADDAGFQVLGLNYYTVTAMEGFATGDQALYPLNLSWIDIDVSATSTAVITLSNPLLCQGSTQSTTASSNTTQPTRPAAGSALDIALKDLDEKVGEAFIRLVTDSIIVVLILAFFEVILSWQAPRVMGRFYPSVTNKASGRERVWAISATVLTLFCFIIFLSGMTRNYAQIVGLKVETNYSNPQRPSAFSPAPPDDSTTTLAPGAPQPRTAELKASGLEASIWTFAGATVKVDTCPQYYPCSPNCKDLCQGKSYSWSAAPWPYCPGSSFSNADTSSCYNEASDVYSHVTFLILFFLAIIPPVFFFSTVYRRLPISHACLMMVGLNMSLLWKRVETFMTETLSNNFAPAASMVQGYRLFMDNDSQWLMRVGAILLFVLIGVYALVIIFELYSASKEEIDRRHFNENFEGKVNELREVTSAQQDGSGDVSPRAEKEQPFLL